MRVTATYITALQMSDKDRPQSRMAVASDIHADNEPTGTGHLRQTHGSVLKVTSSVSNCYIGKLTSADAEGKSLSTAVPGTGHTPPMLNICNLIQWSNGGVESMRSGKDEPSSPLR